MPLTTTILGQEGEPTILALITQTSKFPHRKFDNPQPNCHHQLRPIKRPVLHRCMC